MRIETLLTPIFPFVEIPYVRNSAEYETKSNEDNYVEKKKKYIIDIK
jgi:glutaredoxin 2